MAQTLLGLYFAVCIGLAFGSATPAQTCDGPACPVPVSSILQVRTAQRSGLQELSESEADEGSESTEYYDASLHEFLTVDAEESSETETDEELQEEEFEGGRIEIHEGSQVIIHDDSEVAVTGKGKWIITVPANCTTDDVNKMADNMPKGSTPEFKGDPSAGGLCVFMMLGTKAQVIEELKTHTWPSKPIVESDKKWALIPDLNKTEKDDDYPAALLETDIGGQSNPPSWGLDRVDDRQGFDKDYSMPAATSGGAGVHVFVADTGIRTTHKDFGGRAIPTLEVLSSTPKVCTASDTSCAFDRQGHGTHCAGTIGGASYGVAKSATLHAVKVLSDSGSGSFSWFIEAMDWVMKSGTTPAVFSASLGGRGTISTVKTAIDKAVAAGVVVVVAAGNDGRSSVPDACKYSPAYVPSAITVGSTTSSDSRSSFSSYGKCLDIYAPGSGIKSAGHRSDTGSATMSGTSMACPHVAGASALILGEDSTRSATDVLNVMLSRATANVLKDTKPGSPNLMLYTGLDTAAPTPAPPPTPSPTPSPTPAPTPAPPVPPIQATGTCSFESTGGQCAVWYNAKGDKFDWTRKSGRTPSSNTGPDKAADGGFYMYIETSYPRRSGDTAILKSRPLLFPNGPAVLKFKYHMFGGNIGSLKVMVDNKVVWQQTGNKGNSWKDGTIALVPSIASPPVVSFVGTRGSSWAGDIAIDKLEFFSTGSSPPSSPAPSPTRPPPAARPTRPPYSPAPFPTQPTMPPSSPAPSPTLPPVVVGPPGPPGPVGPPGPPGNPVNVVGPPGPPGPPR